MSSPKSATVTLTHAARGYSTTHVHRCLFVSEILRLICLFIRLWDEDARRGHGEEDMDDLDMDARENNDGKKTLASLARTCRSFSAVALDLLWRVLNSLDPLLTICPKPEDDTDWSMFHKYGYRVRSIQIRGRDTRVPASAKRTLAASLDRYPNDCLFLPNLTEFDWRETTYLSLDDSGVPLLKYFAGPAITTLSLSFIRTEAPSASDLAMLSDLPNLSPNVTSFTIFFSCSWLYDPSRQVGEMASRWKKLQTLRSCAIPQSDMDKLASRRTLHTLGVEVNNSSPTYAGKVPETVQEWLLSPRNTATCTNYLQHLHGSPTVFRIFVGMNNVNESEVDAMFQLLPHSLDPSRLEYLTVLPRSVFMRTRLTELPRLRPPLVDVLVQFSHLRELDLDLFCASQTEDGEYARLARALPHLRHLRMGTAKSSSVVRPYPVATVVALIAVVTRCPDLETLCMPFDGTIAPPSSLVGDRGRGGSSVVVVKEGVPNERITKLHVGHSLIADTTISILASCLKSLMPNLRQIQHHNLGERWDAVQSILTC